jgi:hypothetical protein
MNRTMSPEAFLSMLFASLVAACGPEDTTGDECEATTEMGSMDVLLADDEFATYLDENGELSEDACQMICEDNIYLDESDTILAWTDCTAGPGPGTGHEIECAYSYRNGCAVSTAGRNGRGVRCYGEGVGVGPVARWAARMAHAEASSVRAFVDLGRELDKLQAPRELAHRARAAARDEVVHARAMNRLAKRFGGRPSALRFQRVPEDRSALVVARENVAEGCVRETWAALVAHHQSRCATDPEIRAVMKRIAVDETRHAALAHDIDAWFRGILGTSDRVRLDTTRRRTVASLGSSNLGSAPSLVRIAGLPNEARARNLLAALERGLWIG